MFPSRIAARAKGSKENFSRTKSAFICGSASSADVDVERHGALRSRPAADTTRPWKISTRRWK